METGSFQCCPVPGQKARDTNCNSGDSPQTSGNTFSTESMPEHWHRLPERLWIPHPWKYQKTSGNGFGKPVLSGPG